MPHSAPYTPLQIVIPVFNDWESLGLLLPLVDERLGEAGIEADVLFVDDGSTVPAPGDWGLHLRHVRTIRVVRLRRNVGHQRAICVGLCFLDAESDCRRVLVMDGDGEDDPADIPALLEKLSADENCTIAFAERLKRSEGFVFTFFYALYRLLHRLLVGHRVRVGNFSVMKRPCLESLCASPEMWNHYAAAVYATRQPMAFVPTHRAKRLAGHSTMNFPALVTHGLSALSVFSDRISARLLIAAAITGTLALAGIATAGSLLLATGRGIPGWAATAAGVLALFLAQITLLAFTFCFLVLITRGQNSFIPARDFRHFILGWREAWRA